MTRESTDAARRRLRFVHCASALPKLPPVKRTVRDGPDD